MRFLRQNATHKVICGPFVDVTDGATKETGVLLSTADQAEALRHDGTTVVDISGYTWAAITTMDGYYNLTLQTGITDTVGHLVIDIADVSVCLPVREEFTVLEEEVYDAYFASGAAGFQAGPTIAVPSNTTKPPVNPTLEEATMYIYWRLVYGTIGISATEEVVYADDGTTELYTKGITDSAGVVTYAEAVAGT